MRYQTFHIQYQTKSTCHWENTKLLSMMFDVESNGIAEVIKYKSLGGCKSYCIIIGIEKKHY